MFKVNVSVLVHATLDVEAETKAEALAFVDDATMSMTIGGEDVTVEQFELEDIDVIEVK